MPRFIEAKPSAEGLRFGIVVARWNAFVTEALLEGAVNALVEHGARDEDILVVRVPGAFEIGPAALRLFRHGYAGVICLGAVIRGDTPHFDYVSRAVADAVNELAVRQFRAVTFGVLTTDNVEQAIARAGQGQENKGREAALACMEMVQVIKKIESPGYPEAKPLEHKDLPAKKGKP